MIQLLVICLTELSCVCKQTRHYVLGARFGKNSRAFGKRNVSCSERHTQIGSVILGIPGCGDVHPTEFRRSDQILGVRLTKHDFSFLSLSAGVSRDLGRLLIKNQTVGSSSSGENAYALFGEPGICPDS